MVRILPCLIGDDVGQYPFVAGILLHPPRFPFLRGPFEFIVPLTHCVIPPTLDAGLLRAKDPSLEVRLKVLDHRIGLVEPHAAVVSLNHLAEVPGNRLFRVYDDDRAARRMHGFERDLPDFLVFE